MRCRNELWFSQANIVVASSKSHSSVTEAAWCCLLVASVSTRKVMLQCFSHWPLLRLHFFILFRYILEHFWLWMYIYVYIRIYNSCIYVLTFVYAIICIYINNQQMHLYKRQHYDRWLVKAVDRRDSRWRQPTGQDPSSAKKWKWGINQPFFGYYNGYNVYNPYAPWCWNIYQHLPRLKHPVL